MKYLIVLLSLIVLVFDSVGQIAYTYIDNKNFSLGSYGRIGVDWSHENGGSIGRRLNLNNMGSIGGRLEEQDYMELAPVLYFKPFKNGDSTEIYVQTRFAFYSQSLSLLGNSTTSSIGGITIAMPEIFVEAKNINNTGINVWVGSRFYRGADVHVIDHFYFNDHSGQGAGIEFRKTRLAAIFVSSIDTSSTLPPYFYLNFATGTPTVALRQRVAYSLEQDFHLSQNHVLTLLGEYHHMGGGTVIDSIPELSYGSDIGFVVGARLYSNHRIGKGGTNNLALRLGTGIANGGEGGLSKTWLTFGAPNQDTRSFKGAYSISFVEDFFVNISSRNALSAYSLLTYSKGAASTNGMADSYFGREVYNRKIDFSMGFRDMHVLTNKFKLLTEAHFSQRMDGTNPWAQCVKVSLAPVFSPTGNPDFWARPEIRLITSLAYYNKFAAETLYSPYLAFVGERRFGYYLGLKAEWWLWKNE